MNTIQQAAREWTERATAAIREGEGARLYSAGYRAAGGTTPLTLPQLAGANRRFAQRAREIGDRMARTRAYREGRAAGQTDATTRAAQTGAPTPSPDARRALAVQEQLMRKALGL